MITKLLGAILIISAGYIFGKKQTDRLKRRGAILRELMDLMQEFDVQLREYRTAFFDFLQQKGTLGASLMNGELIDGLKDEEMERVRLAVSCFRSNGYGESCEASQALLSFLNDKIISLDEEIKTTEKTMPLICCTVCALIVILIL